MTSIKYFVKKQEKIVAVPSENQILIEEKKIKTFGENYIAIKIKNKTNLNKLFILFCIFLVISAVILLILYLCGI